MLYVKGSDTVASSVTLNRLFLHKWSDLGLHCCPGLYPQVTNHIPLQFVCFRFLFQNGPKTLDGFVDRSRFI